jgi:hypothetical protein
MDDHTARTPQLDKPVPLSSKLLDAGAAVLQSHAPVRQLSLHLISLPCYTHSLHKQRLTHHYCHRLSSDVWQCVMYDRSDATSRLIGVEYVIGEDTFRTLPDDEKRMWHSHHQEIRGGNTIAPGLPEAAEKAVMQELANTYGKAIHVWAAQDPLPYGPPKLIVTMCTDDTQAKYAEEDVWRHKDESTGTRSTEKAEGRKGLEYHERAPGADQWERGGELYEFVLVPVKRSKEVEALGGIRNQHRTTEG